MDMTAISHTILEKTAFSPSKIVPQHVKTTAQMLVDNAAEAPINEALHKQVVMFLTTKKKLIYTAYKSNPEELHYCIILGRDTRTNRSKFYHFLHAHTDNDEGLPSVMFQFVGKQFEQELESNMYEKIKL